MIYDLYSKRSKTGPDVFEYDKISPELRIQISYLLLDFFRDHEIYPMVTSEYWKFIHEILLREHAKIDIGYSGPFSIDDGVGRSVLNYLYSEGNTNRVLDIVELAFRLITRFELFQKEYPQAIPKKALAGIVIDLNTRFKEHAVGYKFENRSIIRFDNELLHTTIIKPALEFLTHSAYKPINDEFLNAHDHFRHGRNKECINECLKAFESTMKIICHNQGYMYDQKATSVQLLQILFDNNYIPSYMQNQFKGLRAILEGGIPAIRNNTSAHGQGVSANVVNPELAQYTLNLTGSTIKFLLELNKKDS
jgi:hypothetical protein